MSENKLMFILHNVELKGNKSNAKGGAHVL